MTLRLIAGCQESSAAAMLVASGLLLLTGISTGCGSSLRSAHQLTGPSLFPWEKRSVADAPQSSSPGGPVAAAGHVESPPGAAQLVADGHVTPSRVPGRVEHADANSFGPLVLESDVPVLVDFYATWCGPCKKLAPTLDELAGEIDTARIVKVNIDDSPRLAKTYKVRSVPALFVFDQGKVVARRDGSASKTSIRKLLEL